MHALATTLALAATLATAQDRLDLTELLLDPVGTNAGTQRVELHNPGSSPVDLTGWHLVMPQGTWALPGMVIPANGHLLLHPAATGTSSASDIFLPTMPVLGTSGSIAVFRSANALNPTDLVDFVSWGGGQGAIVVATLARRWPSTTDTLAIPTIPGRTLAHYDQHAYGANRGSQSWFVDSTPTLGGRNDSGGLYAAYYGCPTLPAPPQLGTGENDNRPWIGETWRLDTSYLPVLPTFLFVAIGLQPLPPFPLDGFGIPGCEWSTSTDIVFATQVTTYPEAVLVQVPSQQLLIGYPLEVQAMVVAPAANPAGLLPTRSVIGYPGSR